MDSLSLLPDLADLDDLMFALDLASGYHHQVEMDPKYYKPWLSMDGTVSCFQSPALWTCFCPLGLHQNYEVNLHALKLPRSPTGKLFG